MNAIEQHSIHSPFIYELYTQIIKSEYPDPNFERIEKIRHKIIGDEREIVMNDLGAGSKYKNGDKRKIGDIAKQSLSPPKVSKLIYRLIKQNECEEVVELGTSLGINSLYMNSSYEKIRLNTFEGDERLANYAEKVFEMGDSKGIKLIKGDINKTLSNYLAFSRKIDLAYLDANHTHDATMRYFNMLAKKSHDDTIFIIGDIHWSSEMERAWKEIKNSPYITLSIDLFHVGIVFFKPDIARQHYILEF